MPIDPGVHRYGPQSATLHVETGRRGAASKAGHDLVIEVTAWEAALEVNADGTPTAITASAEPRSLRVLEGKGGVQDLKQEDKDEIRDTIDRQVLGGQPIEFRSTGIDSTDDGRGLRVAGTLEMAGESHPIELGLAVDENGAVTGGVTLRQTDWGITPYSGLFGALKVADEVRVLVEAGPTGG